MFGDAQGIGIHFNNLRDLFPEKVIDSGDTFVFEGQDKAGVPLDLAVFFYGESSAGIGPAFFSPNGKRTSNRDIIFPWTIQVY